MPSTNNVNQTTDTVKREVQIMSDTILETDVFTKFKVVPAVRDRFSMWTGSTANMVQDYSDSPTETGDVNISDQEFTIEKKSIFHGVPYDKFKDTEMNVSISNLKDQGLPTMFTDFIAKDVGLNASKSAAKDIYNGEGGLTGDPTGGVNGLAKIIKDRLTASSLTSRIISDAVNDPSSSTTIDNALAAMKVQFSEDMIENKDEFVILMNGVVNDAWYSHLSNVAATNIPQNDALKFENYNIEIAKGLSSRRMIFCKKENINVSLAVSGDLVSLDIVDQYSLGQGNKARAVGNYGYGVGIATDDFVIFEYTA